MHGVVLYMVGILGLFWSQTGSGFQFKPSAGLLLPNMGQVPLHGGNEITSFFSKLRLTCVHLIFCESILRGASQACVCNLVHFQT